jgi:hypothetical protein
MIKSSEDGIGANYQIVVPIKYAYTVRNVQLNFVVMSKKL